MDYSIFMLDELQRLENLSEEYCVYCKIKM